MRQCVIACDSDERALKYVVDYLKRGEHGLEYGLPASGRDRSAKALPELDAQPIPDEAKRKILWDNAIKLFGPRILN